MNDDSVPRLNADDCEVIPTSGGRFIVRVGCVCAELSLDELMRLRQVLTARVNVSLSWLM